MSPESEIVDIIKRLYTNKLTTSSGGNISMIDRKGKIYITPSAIDKSSLNYNDIVKIYKNGKIRGRHKPSSEYPFHQAIYNNCPDIKAIIHAHPPFIVSYCITAEKLNTAIQPDIYNICGEIGSVPYFCPGSNDLANVVANEFKKGFSMVMLQNHGIVAGAATIKEAYHKIVMLNICAEASINAKQLGKLNLLTQNQLEFSTKENFFLQKCNYTQKANFSKKLEFANTMIERAFKQNLLNGRLGAISFKTQFDSAIISKKNPDWEHFKFKDFYTLNKHDFAQTPIQFQTMFLFRKIYQNHPEINCIIHSYAPACFAFSLTDKLFNTKTVPESYIILRDIAYANYEDFYTNYQAITNLISDSKPLVFLKNNGVLVTGNSISQAFDRIEVAEFTAKSIINAQNIGNIHSIREDEIDMIKRSYLI